MKNEETSRFPFCPEMRCLLAHLPDAKRLGSVMLFFHFCLLNFQSWPAGCFCQTTMSSFESTDEKMVLPVELSGGENHRQSRPPDADRHISFTLAHELNNLLTVVQGHADHLFAKHQENAALAPNLKKIADAAHRAAELVRNAPKLDFPPAA